ncbi:MAG: MarR family winged helix-turn-helix transcriptional regulator [Solirubrobacteraceae bacterium]
MGKSQITRPRRNAIQPAPRPERTPRAERAPRPERTPRPERIPLPERTPRAERTPLPEPTPRREPTRRRAAQLEEIAEGLPQRANTLSKLFLSRSSVVVSRTEVGVLRSLRARPRRITELAAEERVTQPAITLLVNRLADKGWVERTTDPTDRRAVLVSLTPAGEDAFDRLRAEYHALLQEEISRLDDHEVETLAGAVGILDQLIERLRSNEA